MLLMLLCFPAFIQFDAGSFEIPAQAAQASSQKEILYSSGNDRLIQKGGKICFYSGGKLKKKTWKTIQGNTYYFKKNGCAATGRILIRGKYYLFSGKGVLYKEGWKKEKKGIVRYYSPKDGHMFTGIHSIGGKLYGFNRKGILVKNGRLSYAWFDRNGVIQSKKSRRISTLKSQVRKCIRSFPGSWSVYVKNLTTNESFTINNKKMYAASLIKLFAMGAAYQKVSERKLSLSSVSGLIIPMIADSDNSAFNSVIRTIGLHTVNRWCKSRGYTKTKQVHGLSPSYNSAGLRTSGGSNTTSVKDCGRFLEAVYNGTCVNSKYSKKMLSALKKITPDKSLYYRSKLPSGIPGSAVVANKTGDLDDYSHDCAIVYGKNADYIICVMAHVPGQGYSCSSCYQKLSSLVYRFFN